MDGPQFKLDNDPRVTRIGRILRPLSIDELPQLFNVLFGQMSFVGPRPSPFRENQMCVPWREGRLSVRPGITGLWQVCRHDRSIGDFHQWIYYDLLYVRNMSFLVDLKIVLATIVTLGGKWSVPLDWILSRQRFNDRRRVRRLPDAPGAPDTSGKPTANAPSNLASMAARAPEGPGAGPVTNRHSPRATGHSTPSPPPDRARILTRPLPDRRVP